MSTPKRLFQNGSYYHLFNRGIDKADIFWEAKDFERFLESLIYYQQDKPQVRYSYSNFKPGKRSAKVNFSIVCYCLMPNHFHLLVRQESDGGIKETMSLFLNSYAKYFNTKYNRSGPLFQGRFKSVLVSSDEQLVYLARYILLNPYVAHLTNSPEKYQWSAYKEYFFGKTSLPICTKSNLLGIFQNNITEFSAFVSDYADFARTKKDMQKLLLD